MYSQLFFLVVHTKLLQMNEKFPQELWLDGFKSQFSIKTYKVIVSAFSTGVSLLNKKLTSQSP